MNNHRVLLHDMIPQPDELHINCFRICYFRFFKFSIPSSSSLMPIHSDMAVAPNFFS